ncbi:MAG TPA: GNAT family N-acetyltransferase [Phycicoccus elongatus]|nr:GNAT family N-acetyltransferase [Phycicoccus elongatus]
MTDDVTPATDRLGAAGAHHLSLPSGLSSRALVPSDVRGVFEVVAAAELADIGDVAIEEADLVADWQRPSFDLSAQTVGVFDGDRLIAYGEHTGGDRVDAAVHPAYRGRGVGTAVARWIQATARAAGASVVGMPVPAGSPSEALLRALGYRQRWTSWILELPAGREIASQSLPDGFSLRIADGEADQVAAWEVIEDAFLEWSTRPRTPYADWAAVTIGRPGFEPWNLRLAIDPAGAVVGVSLVLLGDPAGYVDKLAVRTDVRNQGIARALLADSFAAAMAHGASRCELSTDSRTGALGLYEKVGMEVTSTWFNLAIDL